MEDNREPPGGNDTNQIIEERRGRTYSTGA